MSNSYFRFKELLAPPVKRAAYSDRTAWLMAEMSRLAYSLFEKDYSELKESLSIAGFDLVKLFNDNNCKVEKVEYSMIFFTQLLINLVKIAYSLKESSYEKQSDVLKVQKSFVFKIYKILFFIQLVFMYVDILLAKFMKGSNILILAKKEK